MTIVPEDEPAKEPGDGLLSVTDMVKSDGFLFPAITLFVIIGIALENRKHEVLITYDGEECLKSYRDADDKFVYEQQQSADPKTFHDDTNNPPLMELS